MAILSFLDRLDEEDRVALLAAGALRRTGRNELLLAQGQVADRVLVLCSGWVKVIGASPSRGDAILALRGPGSIVGEQALVDGEPRGASVVTLMQAEVLVLPASAFRALLERRPTVMLALLGDLSERLRASDRRLVEFAATDTLGRLCARLTDLGADHGEQDPDGGGLRLTLPLTQEDLAGWTGASIEATGKSLRVLRDLGWISTARRSIVLHDPAAIAARAAPA